MTNRTDTFVRTSNPTVIDPPSDGGSGYTIAGGVPDPWGILTNLGYLPATTVSNNAAVLDSASSNIEIEIPIQNGPSSSGICARYADLSNFIMLFCDDSTTLTLYKRVAGSFTAIQSTGSLTLAAGDVFKLRCDSANLLTGYQNGVSRCSGTDSAGSTNTKHGMYTQNARRYGDGTRGLIITDISAGGSVITSAGSSSVTNAGASSVSVPVASAGVAGVTLRSQSSVQSVLTSAGASTVALTSASTAGGAISSAGNSTVNIVGTTLGVTGVAVSIAGAAGVNLGAASVTGAAVTVPGASTVVLKGAIAGAVNVTRWGRYPRVTQKKLDEDEEAETIQLLTVMAPELIRRARMRH